MTTVSENNVLSNNNLLLFKSDLTNGKDIRVVGTTENPLFIAKDIGEILGYIDTKKAIVDNVDEEDKITWSKLKSKGGCQLPLIKLHPSTVLINESGLYSLILRSKLESAKKFKRWITAEVLPSIRKTGQYNIEQLKKTIEEKEVEIAAKDLKITEKEEQITEIKTELVEEQKIVMKTKKSLMATQRRFMHRHKFRINGCVYVLENPDEKYNKFKIGFSKDMNQRLEDDRTMIPNIKVRMILYTIHYEVFEKCIKIRYKDQLELPSHEWVFEELEKLIETIKELDKVNRFSGILETQEELNKYNLDDTTEVVRKNVPEYYGKLTPKLARLLPSYLVRHDYLLKNDNAPAGNRWCNGWCQCYKVVTDFIMRSEAPMTICMHCENMVDLAEIKINAGEMTDDQIRKNPASIMLRATDMVCRKCHLVKDKGDFPEKRRQCNKCRQSVKSLFRDKFDDVIEDEIKKLCDMNVEDRTKKLEKYIRDELVKIAQFLKIGRKYNDTKPVMLEKVKEHFNEKNK